MGRKERRAMGITQKPKTYVLTDEQIAQIKKEAVDEAVTLLLTIPVTVLHDKFGFGRIRLDRFSHYVFGWIEGIQKGEVSLDELRNVAESEAGFQINITKGGRR